MSNFDFSRRDALLVTGAASVGLLTAPALAQGSNAPAVYTPNGLQRDLPEDAANKPRAVFRKLGNFQLDDPAELSWARTKALFSLDGSNAYVIQMSRYLLCPKGQPAHTIVNELQFWRSFMEVVETDATTGQPSVVTIHSLFTRYAVDPDTLEPVREVRFEDTGQTIIVPDTLFAASINKNLLTGQERYADNAGEKSSTEGGGTGYMRMGSDLVFFGKGGPTNEGEHQPQVDMSNWAAPLSEVMDPSIGSANARYSFSGISTTNIFSWAKEYTANENTQVLAHKWGIKSPTFEALPDAVKRSMQGTYPDRI